MVGVIKTELLSNNSGIALEPSFFNAFPSVVLNTPLSFAEKT